MKDSNSFDELDRSAEHNRSRTRLHVVPDYNNETVYLGVAATTPTAKPYNNETVVLGAAGEIASNINEDSNNNMLKYEALDMDYTISPLKETEQRFLASTSTPRASEGSCAKPWTQMSFRHVTHEYDNPLLNGHAPDLQHWLHDLRSSYEHEVMSTLQTKSIAQEAF